MASLAALLRILECFLVLSAVFPNLASASSLNASFPGKFDICRVKARQGAGGTVEELRVSVIVRWNPQGGTNERVVAFGYPNQAEQETETTVTCKDGSSPGAFPPGCKAWPEGQQPVNDVSECPSCECVQDTSKGPDSAAINMIFEDGVQPVCKGAVAEAPVDVLLFGLGGGALHTYTMQQCPEHTRVESVEADPRMAAVATKFFGVPVKDEVSFVHVDDASKAAVTLVTRLNEASLEKEPAGQQRRILRHSPYRSAAALGKAKWDVVATDCFIDHGLVPESCRSKEFLTNLRLLVKPGGTIMQHMWHESPYAASVTATFKETVELYKAVFGEDNVSVKKVPRDPSVQWDSIIFVKG